MRDRRVDLRGNLCQQRLRLAKSEMTETKLDTEAYRVEGFDSFSAALFRIQIPSLTTLRNLQES